MGEVYPSASKALATKCLLDGMLMRCFVCLRSAAFCAAPPSSRAASGACYLQVPVVMTMSVQTLLSPAGT